MLLVHLFVCFTRFTFCPFPLSSWCRGLAAVCDCGSPWTFLLTFFVYIFALFMQSGRHSNYFSFSTSGCASDRLVHVRIKTF